MAVHICVAGERMGLQRWEEELAYSTSPSLHPGDPDTPHSLLQMGEQR